MLLRQCQVVRYDCIIKYRSEPQPAPLPRIDSSNWCKRPEIAPCSEFHRGSVFICQENIHALLSRVSGAYLSDYLSALLCYVHLSEVARMVAIGFRKCLFIYNFYLLSVDVMCIQV